MSKFQYLLRRSINPAFGGTLEILQRKDVKVYKGAGVTSKVGEVLKKKGLKNPIIITDKMLISLGLLDKTIESIKASGLSYHLFDGVTPDPSSDLVDAGVKALLENKCDSVISFGGGSAIDAAKVIAARGANPKFKKYTGLTKMQSFSMRKGVLPILAVPTTAGTGAERTAAAIISNSKTHAKEQVIDFGVVAKDIFLDPTLTTGLPEHITNTTAFDALSHALEAYCSRIATKASDKDAEEAIIKIFKYLPIAMKDPKNIEARQELLIASNLAGKAIGRAYIGPVHAMAHNAGAICGIPHGLIISGLVPRVFSLYKKTCEKKYARLAVLLNLGKESEKNSILAQKFIDRLFSFSDEMKIPKIIEKLDRSKFDEIIKKAMKENNLYSLPQYVSPDDMRKIFMEISK